MEDDLGSLMFRTLVMARNDQRNILSIHKASGLPLYWLRAFIYGKIKDPSVNKVQKLYEHYTGKPLI